MQECEGKSELVRILPEYSCIAEAHPYMWARSDQIYAEAESNARADLYCSAFRNLRLLRRRYQKQISSDTIVESGGA